MGTIGAQWYSFHRGDAVQSNTENGRGGRDTDVPAPRRGLFGRLLDALLTTDPHQRIRLTMAGLGALFMLCCIVAMHVVTAAGLADALQVWVWTLFCLAGIAGVYGLIRSGWSLRLRDPSLTLWQILYAVACNATAYVIAGSARGITLPILAVILMFGIFGLSIRQMLGVLLFSLCAFGAAIGGVEWRPDAAHPPALSAAYAIMILVVLLGSTFLTTRIQAARRRLQLRKRELAAALEQVRELAMYDELTGLLNRRQMAELMRMEFLRGQRTERSLVLVLFDIDYFKDINDSFGHAAGDAALRSFAQTLRRLVRGGDEIARWGGEEFLLMLRDVSEGETRDLLERVRSAVVSMEVAGTPAGTRFTVSGGYARRTDGESWEQLIERADQALYKAKALGRNRMESADAVEARRT